MRESYCTEVEFYIAPLLEHLTSVWQLYCMCDKQKIRWVKATWVISVCVQRPIRSPHCSYQSNTVRATGLSGVRGLLRFNKDFSM